MSSAASLLQEEEDSGDAAALADRFPARPASRRALHRRGSFVAQLAFYLLGSLTLLLYAHAGTVTLAIPSAFFIAGVSLIGVFAALSEAGVNDRFKDQFLTVQQVVGHVVLQLGFLLAAPQIGYTFLTELFLIFAMAALRMTPRQTMAAWLLTAIGVAAILLLTTIPIGLPVQSLAERMAAGLCFVVTIGQCAFIGLYGDSLRKTLTRRGAELREAYERIEQLAELDELTGCFNRRSIMRRLEEEAERAGRSGLPCSIALIDLDWFKRINDVHGHPAGDEVLKTFAIGLFANLRGIDRLGRYGGEEFLLLLPETDPAQAGRLVDRLRAIIAELDWSAFAPGMQVTLSAGLATLRPDESPEALLARADQALYAAKAGGRNRIAVA